MNRSFSRILPALALVCALGTSGVAMAQGASRPKPGLSPDQQAKIVQMYKDFRKDTQEMRTKLYAKRLALDSLARSGNADPKRIEELAAEIAQLRTDIGQKRMEMRETMQNMLLGILTIAAQAPKTTAVVPITAPITKGASG